MIAGVLFIFSFVYWLGPILRQLSDNEIYQTIESREIDAGALFYTDEDHAINANRAIYVQLGK